MTKTLNFVGPFVGALGFSGRIVQVSLTTTATTGEVVEFYLGSTPVTVPGVTILSGAAPLDRIAASFPAIVTENQQPILVLDVNIQFNEKTIMTVGGTGASCVINLVIDVS